MTTITAKQVKNNTYTITITETNYSGSDNKGLLLGRTLIHFANQYCDGVKTSVIWKDINSNDKFLMNLTDGKMLLKNSEFIPCTLFTGFNNDVEPHFTSKNWNSKTNVVCKNYTLNKF